MKYDTKGKKGRKEEEKQENKLMYEIQKCPVFEAVDRERELLNNLVTTRNIE